MRKRFAFAGAAALALFMVPAAYAAVTVIGSSRGHDCYSAAIEGRADRAAIDTCTGALENEAFGSRDRAATLVNRGVVYLHRREWAEALADFDRAIGMRPQLGEAHVDRGAALIMLRDYAGAIQAITHGLTLDPEDPHEAYFNRGLAHEYSGDIRAAYLDYRRAAELAPEWPRPQLEMARFTVTRAPAAAN